MAQRWARRGATAQPKHSAHYIRHIGARREVPNVETLVKKHSAQYYTIRTAVNAATLPAKVTGVQALELEGHVQAAIIELLLADDRLYESAALMIVLVDAERGAELYGNILSSL